MDSRLTLGGKLNRESHQVAVGLPYSEGEQIAINPRLHQHVRLDCSNVSSLPRFLLQTVKHKRSTQFSRVFG